MNYDASEYIETVSLVVNSVSYFYHPPLPSDSLFPYPHASGIREQSQPNVRALRKQEHSTERQGEPT